MQKLTHTSSLWQIGGVAPYPDVWLVPPPHQLNRHQYLFLVQREGLKNKVRISLLVYDSDTKSIIEDKSRSNIPAKDMKQVLYAMSNEVKNTWKENKTERWGVYSDEGIVTYTGNLTESLSVYLDSIKSFKIPPSGSVIAYN